ncbi:response regulator [Serpentinicella sp. ANB-PHB4]|uniref:response regulator n=1 Tax=Serpentinicella sp. ANB-PHB4 TaxID=3074076 RepID=UPI00285499E5|nr:response regulator [Serpentinicella sp. ANB-PHB4]MDR5659066.1 response regulator [Serpentinicella sp. ANB-PHB4]
MSKEKIEQLIKKSQKQFFIQNKGEITNKIKSLVYLVLQERKESYEDLYRYFHSLKGTAGTLGINTVASIAEEMEIILEKNSSEYTYNNDDVATIFKSLGKILIAIDEYLDEPTEDEYLDETTESITDEIVTLSSDIDENQKINYSGRIIVIDDDIEMLNFLDSILTNYGYKVLISSNPEEAMSLLKTEPFDLVITDIMMPGKTGFDIHNYVIEEKIEIPVIFLTGLHEQDLKWKALRDGVDYFIEKPFEPEELLARAEGIIRKNTKKNLDVFTDELTGAYNRKFFTKRFEEEKEKHKRQNKILSIAFLDLDYFKEINDTYGHVFGDEILQGFVETIKTKLRTYDEIYRYGGDEFLILLPDTNGEEAYKMVERIRESVQRKTYYSEDNKKEITISFSAGIAMMQDYDVSVTDILKQGDAALYISKKNGRNQTTYQYEEIQTRPKRILVVDDAQIVVNLIKTRLIYLGYEVAYAKDGEEALQKIKSFKPDLMLLDLMLPKVSGLEVLQRIKEETVVNKLKVIVVSARNKEKDILSSFHLGAKDFVTKPFSLEVLEEKIKKLL